MRMIHSQSASWFWESCVGSRAMRYRCLLLKAAWMMIKNTKETTITHHQGSSLKRGNVNIGQVLLNESFTWVYYQDSSVSWSFTVHCKLDCRPTTKLYRAALKERIIDWTNLLNKYTCHWMRCWARDERVWMTDDYAQLTWHQLWVACWKCSAFVHIEQNR